MKLSNLWAKTSVKIVALVGATIVTLVTTNGVNWFGNVNKGLSEGATADTQQNAHLYKHDDEMARIYGELVYIRDKVDNIDERTLGQPRVITKYIPVRIAVKDSTEEVHSGK